MKKGMKQLALILSVLMLITVFAGMAPVASAETAADGPVMTKIKASGKLVVGTEAQYAPYEFKDLNANFVGCDMFLAQKIADALGVELEIVDMSFDGIIPAVQAGQVDLGIAAFTNTPARAEVIDFSDLYETSLQYLIVAADKVDTYSTKESLAGLKVGAQRGTIQSQLILSALPDSQLFELDKYPELALEVTNGNIAGLVVDSAVGDSIVATSKGALAVAKSSPRAMRIWWPSSTKSSPRSWRTAAIRPPMTRLWRWLPRWAYEDPCLIDDRAKATAVALASFLFCGSVKEGYNAVLQRHGDAVHTL